MSKSILNITPVTETTVYNFILRSGAAGLTDSEIYSSLNVSERSQRRLRASLSEAGLIINTGTRRLANNRLAAVWKASRVQAALDARKTKMLKTSSAR